MERNAWLRLLRRPLHRLDPSTNNPYFVADDQVGCLWEPSTGQENPQDERRDRANPPIGSPHAQSPLQVARWWRNTPSPAMTTTVILIMRTDFQAAGASLKVNEAMFQNPVMTSTAYAGHSSRPSDRATFLEASSPKPRTVGSSPATVN